MVSLEVLRQWFATGKKPTAEQFAEMFDTFLRKDAKLTIPMIENLATTLGGKEPAIVSKNSAFNKEFGTSAGQVMEGNDLRVEKAVRYESGSLLAPDGSEIVSFPLVQRGHAYSVGDYFREGACIYQVTTAFTSPVETYNSPTAAALEAGWLDLFYEYPVVELKGTVAPGTRQTVLLAGAVSEKIVVTGPGATNLTYACNYKIIAGRTFALYAQLDSLDFTVGFSGSGTDTSWVGEFMLPEGAVAGDTVCYEFKCFSYNVFTLIRKYIVGKDKRIGTSANVPNETVKRDGAGGFSAQIIRGENVITPIIQVANINVSSGLYTPYTQSGRVQITQAIANADDAITRKYFEDNLAIGTSTKNYCGIDIARKYKVGDIHIGKTASFITFYKALVDGEVTNPLFSQDGFYVGTNWELIFSTQVSSALPFVSGTSYKGGTMLYEGNFMVVLTMASTSTVQYYSSSLRSAANGNANMLVVVDGDKQLATTTTIGRKNYSGPFRTGEAKVGDVFEVLDADGKTVSYWTPKADIADAQASPSTTYYNLLWRVPLSLATVILDSGNKIPVNYFPSSLLGSLKYKGVFDGTTVTEGPDADLIGQPLPAANDASLGWYFKAGGTFTVGAVTYDQGDNIISNGTLGYGKIDNTDSVPTVFGRVGPINANVGDYTTAQVTETTKLYFTEARAIASKLTGYIKASAVSTITATTSILQAFGILEKNIEAKADKGTTLGAYGITDAEPKITKNSAFNKNFGNDAGTVSEGNHSHNYSTLSGLPTLFAPTITNPTGQQIIAYDNILQKWINATVDLASLGIATDWVDVPVTSGSILTPFAGVIAFPHLSAMYNTVLPAGSTVNPTLALQNVTRGKKVQWRFHNEDTTNARLINLPIGISVGSGSAAKSFFDSTPADKNVLTLAAGKSLEIFIGNDGRKWTMNFDTYVEV